MSDTGSKMIMKQRPIDVEALQARYALRVTARLSDAAQQAGHHVDERLRVARERALDRARAARTAVASPALVLAGSGGTATLGRGGNGGAPGSWWHGIGLVLPVLALVAGLVLIQYQHGRMRAAAIADIDVDLLVDELPPKAYRDPGFVEFLKTAQP